MEETMKKLLMLLPIAALIFAAFAGCSNPPDDIEAIKELLLTSYFTGEGSDGVTGYEPDSYQDGQGLAGLLAPMPADLPPFVLWGRALEHLDRDVEVWVDGDSAFAVITNNLDGTFYVYNDSTFADTIPYERTIADSTYREVVLSWQGGLRSGYWRIEKLTPAEVTTKDAEHPVQIEKVVVTSVSGENFEITDPKHFYGRDEVPWFTPNDEVTVEVTLKNLADADSVWVYLHHGCHFRRVYRHHRKPFEKEDTWKFTGTWSTADDSLFGQDITVRHAAIDVLYWETLWGDSTAEYSSYALGIPYVIAKEGEELPDDGEDTNE